MLNQKRAIADAESTLAKFVREEDAKAAIKEPPTRTIAPPELDRGTASPHMMRQRVKQMMMNTGAYSTPQQQAMLDRGLSVFTQDELQAYLDGKLSSQQFAAIASRAQ